MKLPFKSLLVVLGLATTAYALALLLSSPQSPLDWLNRLLSPTGLAAMLLCLANYFLRGLRWRDWMIRYQRPLRLGESLRIYLAGYTFTPTPGNLGEAARGILLAKNPLTPLQSLGIFGAERVADLIGLLLLSVPAAVWLVGNQRPDLGPLSLVLGLVGLGLTVAIGWRIARHRLRGVTWMLEAWQCLASRPGRWLGLTLPAWAAQGVAVWLLCQQHEVAINPILAIGMYASAMVGGAVSMLPAGLGGTEALMSAQLMMVGATLGVALSITVLARVLTLWLAVGIGAVALLYSAAIRQDISLR